MDSTQLVKLLPYLPLVLSHIGLGALGFLTGYAFKSWLHRAQPGQAEIVGKSLLAAVLILLYTGSVCWEMISPGYKAPWQFHAIIMVIVGSIFPKKFISFGRNLVDSVTQGEHEPDHSRKRRPRTPSTPPSE